LRLYTPLSPKFLEKLNGKFKDILIKGKIKSTGPLSEELKKLRISYTTTPNFSPF
jgi:hypothetical protein